MATKEDDADAAGAAEAVQAIRAKLDPSERGVFDMMLEGYDATAIAKRLGKQPADLARVMAAIQKVAGDLGG